MLKARDKKNFFLIAPLKSKYVLALLWGYLINLSVLSIFTYLFDLPIRIILYSALLSILLYGMIVTKYYVTYALNYRQVERQALNSKTGISLKRPQEPMEKLYLNVIHEACAKIESLESKVDTEASILMEDYTLWVHQIKTPVSALSLLFQTLEASANKKAMQGELFKIEQYIEMVLYLARLNSNSSDFVFGPFDTKTLVNQSIRKHKTLFLTKGIGISVEIENHSILTDEKWFVILMDQLLSNAIKYSNKGEVTITLNEKNQLIIRDRGIGIDPSDLPRIFEKGFTGINGRFDKKSSGLGLSITKMICDKLNMQIQIESELGRGTQVILQVSPYSHVRLQSKM